MHGGNITLWCDGRSTSTEGVSKQKRDLDPQSYWQGKEAEAESTYMRNMGINMMHQGFVYGQE